MQADTWGAKLLCYGLPGNPHSGDAARWLVPLADAAAEERQPVPQLVHMEELGECGGSADRSEIRRGPYGCWLPWAAGS